MANDGDGGLKLGEPAKLKIVRELFAQFAGESLNALAKDLN